MRLSLRAVMPRLAVFAAACCLAAPASAQAVQQFPEDRSESELGTPLDAAEMRDFHSGKDLAGCYLFNQEDVVWRERMAADGRLYDLEKDAALVGKWWIEGELDGQGVICFIYTDREPGPFCFTGRRRGDYLDFYSAFDGGIVATTQCGDEPIA